MPIIEVKNLKKSYGTKKLFDRFNLELEGRENDRPDGTKRMRKNYSAQYDRTD